MQKETINNLISQAMAIETREAKEAGALGYMARALVQATMPHKKPKTNVFERTNGVFTLTMSAPPCIGLPYGNMPRLLMAWLTTEAVKIKKREILLGNSLSEFMRKLDLICSGGRWGNITRLKEQMKKLFSCSISCSYENKEMIAGLNMHIIDEYHLWWTPKQPEQGSLWDSSLLLGQKFFNEIIKNPIPLDMDALKALKRSPLALDIYCWLTYRMSYLKKEIQIPWLSLQTQFGSEYFEIRDFKKNFLKHLKKVLIIYKANVQEGNNGLLLKPSRTHITRA